MRRRLHALVWVGLVSGLVFASCLARRDKPYTRITDDDAGPPDAKLLDGDMTDVAPDALDLAPHAVLGIDPPHGPYAGGTLVMIRGNGFDSNARVWLGDVEVPRSSVTPVDPQRLQLVTPPGHAGAVDVTVQNGDMASTSGTLRGGFSYDAFYATPSSGPTSGGTIITVEGDGTHWDEDTRVELDHQPCERIQVLSPQKLQCTTPPADAGAKVLTVITGDDVREDALDGFIYGNSDNGFKGGLSGQPLDNELTVLVFNDYTGEAVSGASVLVGDDVASGQLAKTDRNGVVSFSGKLGTKQNVTVAAKCRQPITFYDVAVDHVTVYLSPVLSPDCGHIGELPPEGGTPGVGSGISGEVVWAPDEELKRQGWSNVPEPVGPDEKEVAYVFQLADRPDTPFRLPSPSSAITRSSVGETGYKFYQSTAPGNFTMYALAGLEDDSKTPRVFTAYAMGILRGVAVKPGKTASEVFIQIDVPLDHALKLQLEPPEPGPRGPDRIQASVAIRVEDQGFALLPNGISAHPLPGATDFSIVGVPPLVGTLAGAKYVLGAKAVSGPGNSEPLTVIGTFLANSTAKPLNLGGFVPIPVITKPAENTKWDLSALELTQAKSGQSVDLTVTKIQAGGGLYEWTLVAPGPRDRLKLPNLAELTPDAALPVGSMRITTVQAHIDDFDYGSLRYRQLSARGWNAYAADVAYTQY